MPSSKPEAVPTPASTEPPKASPKALPTWAIVLIFVAGLAIGFVAFWFVWKTQTPKPIQILNVKPPVANVTGQPPTTTVPLPGDVTSTAMATGTTEVGPAKNPYADYLLQPNVESLELPVAWSKPVKTNPKDAWLNIINTNARAGIYDPVTQENLESALKAASGNFTQEADEQAVGTWRLGTVSDGKYKGYVLYEQRDGMCDLGGCTNFRFIVSPDGSRGLTLGQLELTYMKSFRSPPTGEKVGPYLEYEKMLVPAFSLSLKDSNYQAKDLKVNGKTVFIGGLGGWDVAYMSWLRTGGKMDDYSILGKTDDGLTIFVKKDMGCGYVQMPDKSFASLASKIPVKNPEGYEDADRAMDIKWDEKALAGKKPAKLYMATGGGCDTFCPIKAEPGEDVRPESLVKIGTVNNSEPIYLPKDLAKSQTVKMAYDSWYLADGKEKPSFAEFLKRMPVPIFLWQDAFGRWMRYADVTVSPPAECGKPVIYLYPKKTTDVSVKLPRFINVTVSEPAYPARGWQTTAQPDGTLTMADGQKYGSLYWEGTGVGYAPQRQGFIVKDGNQVTFLATTLAKYGLNKTEAKEFMDFWLPRMIGAPYYRVSFMTDDWSDAAPLYVSPRPDTSIRIFMDWQKLSAPMSLEEPKVVTPKRQGFTLVEWGGLLYKN